MLMEVGENPDEFMADKGKGKIPRVGTRRWGARPGCTAEKPTYLGESHSLCRDSPMPAV